jgi:hypothetical protein
VQGDGLGFIGIAENKVTFMNQSERSGQEKPAAAKKASPLRVAKAVLRGPFGVRRRRDHVVAPLLGVT